LALTAAILLIQGFDQGLEVGFKFSPFFYR